MMVAVVPRPGDDWISSDPPHTCSNRSRTFRKPTWRFPSVGGTVVSKPGPSSVTETAKRAGVSLVEMTTVPRPPGFFRTPWRIAFSTRGYSVRAGMLKSVQATS